MITKEQLQEIKKTAEEFFEKMGVWAQIEVEPTAENAVRVNAELEGPGLFIGQQGQDLLSIQHILRAMVRRKIQESFFLDLDINNYKKNKIAYLKELAREVADEVALTKKPKELPPMPAYERRIIHLELASLSYVTTESIGEGLDRRIVIKPTTGI